MIALKLSALQIQIWLRFGRVDLIYMHLRLRISIHTRQILNLKYTKSESKIYIAYFFMYLHIYSSGYSYFLSNFLNNKPILLSISKFCMCHLLHLISSYILILYLGFCRLQEKLILIFFSFKNLVIILVNAKNDSENQELIKNPS